ncbi:hypothetical protein [Sphingobacterium tabacisoli]|uniref:DUF2490 domain-containing protein n=1 Tax=Sphingobacterium tabacisoli TaxID=2044855 RepID=A0ABW5LA74_9SPHI|nr:hypothetical protein [Sphingobacterium tabacisoli]
MKIRLLLIMIALMTLKTNGQKLSYTPDLLLGNRSYAYMHNINYHFNSYLKINNLILFDTEYAHDKENIFFIRNTLSYSISRKISFNAAVGVKNPGKFFGLFAQYRTIGSDYSLSYSMGTTYQRTFTLEQSIAFEYTPSIIERLDGYFHVLAIVNLEPGNYQRGVQQVQLGLKQQRLNYGLALNLDQWNNNEKQLYNTGIFIKHNF